MRIAIYHNLPRGGGKRALYEMAQRLAPEHRLDTFTLSGSEQDFGDLRPLSGRHAVTHFDLLPSAHRPFSRLNKGLRSLDLLRLLKVQECIAGQIDAGNYDVVFVHNCRYGQSPGVLRYLQTPSVYYCAEPPRAIYDPPISRPYTANASGKRPLGKLDPFRWTYRRLLTDLDRTNTRAATLVLTNSAFSRESLYRSYGLFSQVCYLGVDGDCFRPLHLPRQDFVLSVGGIYPHKGFDFLLRSLARLDLLRRPQLLVAGNAGDPEERSYLERLARELAVSLVIRENVTDEELVRLYNHARLTLYAPVMEPFGLVPLESMSSGTPVVGVREGGVRETVVSNVTGLLTERDPEQFAAAINTLLSNPSTHQQYSTRARSYVQEQWRWEQVTQRLIGHFSSVARMHH